MAKAQIDRNRGSLKTTCHPAYNRPYPEDAPAACKSGKCKHSWEARWRDLDGSQPKRTFAQKDAGLKHLNDLYNARLMGEGKIITRKPTGQAPLLEDYVTEKLPDKPSRRKNGMSAETIYAYMAVLKAHCFPRIGKLTIDRIKEAHITKLVAVLEKGDPDNGISPVYANTIKSIVFYNLKPIFEMAIKDGYLKENPCENVKIKDAAKVVRYVPTTEELHLIANKIKRFWRSAIYLMAGCGLREAEVLAITPENIRGDRIFIDRQWRGKQYGFAQLKYDDGSTGRWISLDPIVKNELEQHIEEFGIKPTQPLFYSTKDKTRQSPCNAGVLEDALRLACLLLELEDKKIRPHNFRHFFASMCVERGVEIAEVSKMLGHKNIQTTYDIYYQLPKNLDRIRLAINGGLSTGVPEGVVLVGAYQLTQQDSGARVAELRAEIEALTGMAVILQPYGIAA